MLHFSQLRPQGEYVTKVRTHRQSLKFSGIVIQRLEARPEWRSTARAGMGVASSKRTTKLRSSHAGLIRGTDFDVVCLRGRQFGRRHVLTTAE